MTQKDAKKQLFIAQMKQMRPDQLTNQLKCSICKGLYIFAHTIVDCGHTFCQKCLFEHIKSFKGRNPSVKCSQCHSQIDANYSRSIMRDVFKQNLVDMLQPSYIIQQEKIIKRVQKLFPQQDLQFLLDEFKYEQYQVPSCRKRISQKNVIMGKLVQKIKQVLKINFQTFAEQIILQQKFLQFQQIIKNLSYSQIQLLPKSQRQQKFVGIKNKIKVEGLTVKKLIRFIQKKALEMIGKMTQDLAKTFLNTQKNKVVVAVELYCEDNKLDQNLSLDKVKGPIYYQLL